uniref:Uncharacterized protein n=1 Tax=Micrurus spixii TaxID=129469 RepID=A0A2D4MVL6_9SAUR
MMLYPTKHTWNPNPSEFSPCFHDTLPDGAWPGTIDSKGHSVSSMSSWIDSVTSFLHKTRCLHISHSQDSQPTFNSLAIFANEIMFVFIPCKVLSMAYIVYDVPKQIK